MRSQLFGQIDLEGFNDPEGGFVWSEHRFRMTFPPGGTATVLKFNYYGDTGVLVWRTSEGAFEVDLASGLHAILVTHDARGESVEFEVSPRRMILTDVRDLGVMMVGARHFANAPEAKARMAGDVSILTAKPSKLGVEATLGTDEEVLFARLMESFTEPGWQSAALIQGGRGWTLNWSFYPPLTMPEATVRSCRIRASTGEIISSGFVPASEARPVPNIPGLERAFVCEADVSHLIASHRPGETLGFDLLTPDDRVLLPYQSVYWRGVGDAPMPSPENIVRVAGQVPPHGFVFNGATWATKLEQLYLAYTGRDLDQTDAILDWGCGCGRIFRNLRPSVQAKVQGADIDPVNIEWCRANLKGQFHLIPAVPPTALPRASFDVVFGHSVFTHLTERGQNEWLAELRDLLKPGGLCFVTVMAELAWFARHSRSRKPRHLSQYLKVGISDEGHLDVGVDMLSPGAYRSTQHTLPYVKREWSKFMDVVDIVHGFADLQTLIVLRRRPTA